VATAALRAMHLEWLIRIQAGKFPDNMLVIFLGNPREMSKEYLKIGHNRFLSNSVQSNRIIQYQKIIPCYIYVIKKKKNKQINKEITNSSPNVHSFSGLQCVPYGPPRATGRTVAENQVATVTLGWATETSMPEYNISNFKNA
jgi:hypothetical protein